MREPTIQKRPNIVICLFDDGEFAAYGCSGRANDTPHTDRLDG